MLFSCLLLTLPVSRIMHKCFVLIASLASLVLGVAPCYAWNATGHKATAKIAFEQLLPEQQEAIGRIIRSHPRLAQDFLPAMPDSVEESDQTLWLFEQAAVWPDILRGLNDEEQARYGRSGWHYINLPVYLAAEDEARLQGKLEHNMALEFSPPLRQNLNGVQALKGNLQVWNDVEASDAEKAIALCWILHLVGDLHQPLHTVALFSSAYFPHGDRGGNSIVIADDPEPTNLHSVWDRMPDQFDNLVPSDLTRDMLRTDIVSVTAIDYWIDRHTRMATVFVYTDEVKEALLEGLKSRELPAIELSDYYLDNGILLAKEQVILAGHRIAELL